MWPTVSAASAGTLTVILKNKGWCVSAFLPPTITVMTPTPGRRDTAVLSVISISESIRRHYTSSTRVDSCRTGLAQHPSFSMVAYLRDEGSGVATSSPSTGSQKLIEVATTTATPSTFCNRTKVRLRLSSDLHRPRSLGSLLRRGSGANHHKVS